MSNSEKKSGCGCFAWGCFSIIVLVFVGSYATTVKLKNIVLDFTTTTPIKIEQAEVNPKDLESLQKKFTDIELLSKGSSNQTKYEFSAAEVAAVVAMAPNPELKDNLSLTLNGSNFSGRGNLPLDLLGFNSYGLGGRYLTVEFEFSPQIQEGVLDIIDIKTLKFNGNDAPDAVKNQFKEKNILKKTKMKVEDQQKLQAIKSLKIENSKLVVEFDKEKFIEAFKDAPPPPLPGAASESEQSQP